MPSRNAIKPYIPGGFYHIYNRGVEKRDVFMGPEDYRFFLSTLQSRLLPRRSASTEAANLHGRITLHSYCLMPNHFHLLVGQRDAYDIEALMRSLMTAYVRYFNRRYGRVGSLFQDKYKARYLRSASDFVAVSIYIHRNPGPKFMRAHPYSSFQFYASEGGAAWLHTQLTAQLAGGLDSYVTLCEDEHQKADS